jgi:hypothetical protein
MRNYVGQTAAERLQRAAAHIQRTARYDLVFGQRWIDPDSWQALLVLYSAQVDEQQ